MNTPQKRTVNTSIKTCNIIDVNTDGETEQQMRVSREIFKKKDQESHRTIRSETKSTTCEAKKLLEDIADEGIQIHLSTSEEITDHRHSWKPKLC